jgi:hypothetical protein
MTSQCIWLFNLFTERAMRSKFRQKSRFRRRFVAISMVLSGLALPCPLLATTYYVSPAGADANSGTDPSTPWATIAKVDSASYQPGDQILFQRGGEWHGQLEASSDGSIDHPITYSDYGDKTLSKPIIEGSDYIAPAQVTSLGNGVYSFPTSASPNGKVYWVYLNPDNKSVNANLPCSQPLLAAQRCPLMLSS